MSARPPVLAPSSRQVGRVVLAATMLLVLAACQRGGGDAENPARDAPAPEAPPPVAPPATAAPSPPPVPIAPAVSATDRRAQLRAEKDGEAQVVRTPDYEGARSAATALPSETDDAAAPAPSAASSPDEPPSSTPASPPRPRSPG